MLLHVNNVAEANAAFDIEETQIPQKSHSNFGRRKACNRGLIKTGCRGHESGNMIPCNYFEERRFVAGYPFTRLINAFKNSSVL